MRISRSDDVGVRSGDKGSSRGDIPEDCWGCLLYTCRGWPILRDDSSMAELASIVVIGIRAD